MSAANKARAKARREQAEALASWTAPVGSAVIVTRDNGERFATTTQSMPWQLGDGTPVISVAGITGDYLLTRVRLM